MRLLTWLGIALWVPFLFLALGATGCVRTVEKLVERSQPRVVGVEITLTDVTPTTLKGEASITVHNPAPLSLTIQEFSYQVFYHDGVEWRPLANGRAGETRLEGGKEATLTVPAHISSQEAVGALYRLLVEQGRLLVRLDGSLNTRVDTMDLRIPVRQQVRLTFQVSPAGQPPVLPPRP